MVLCVGLRYNKYIHKDSPPSISREGMTRQNDIWGDWDDLYQSGDWQQDLPV